MNPFALRTVNGILPLWKAAGEPAAAVCKNLIVKLAEDVGVQFRFLRNVNVAQVSELSAEAEGVSVVALGSAVDLLCSLKPQECEYRVRFSVPPNSLMNRDFLDRKLLQMKDSLNCLITNDATSSQIGVTITPENCKSVLPLSAILKRIEVYDLKPNLLNIEFVIQGNVSPHSLIDQIPKELNVDCKLQQLIRSRFGPFSKKDCVSEDDFTLEKVKKHMKLFAVMNSGGLFSENVDVNVLLGLRTGGAAPTSKLYLKGQYVERELPQKIVQEKENSELLKDEEEEEELLSPVEQPRS